jgi:hypothetical protein
MTDAEKQAFLMFAGTMHGLAKQTDQMLVGQSVNLRPISNDIEAKFTQVLQAPTQQYNPYIETPPTEPYVYQQPEPVAITNSPQGVGVEQAIRELEAIQPVSRSTNIVNNDIVDVLKEISLNLGRIATTLESHGGQKRTKNTKTV